MSSIPISELAEATIRHLIAALESLTDGELAVDILIACGRRTVPFLSQVLLDGPTQSIAVSRCRAVRALGGLGEKQILLQYLRDWKHPADPAVTMAEDAVRSAAAKELLRWPSQEVFDVLLTCVRDRASLGLVEAIGAFGRTEAVPVLFQVLQDDVCGNAAKEMLRRTPESTKAFALQLLASSYLEDAQLPSMFHMLRSSLALLSEMNISRTEWASIHHLLNWLDAEIVVACAEIGMRTAPAKEHPAIVSNIFRILPACNWLQEFRTIELLEIRPSLAISEAIHKHDELLNNGCKMNLMNPAWRVIDRFHRPAMAKKEKENVA